MLSGYETKCSDAQHGLGDYDLAPRRYRSARVLFTLCRRDSVRLSDSGSRARAGSGRGLLEGREVLHQGNTVRMVVPPLNLAASVDAPIAYLIAFEHHWRRATDQRC